MNVFEACRRLVVVITAIILVFSAYKCWEFEPHFRINLFSATFRVDSCDTLERDAKSVDVKSKASVKIYPCRPIDMKNSNQSYQPDWFIQYQLGNEEAEKIAAQASQLRSENYLDVLKPGLTVILILWVATFCIGWVIRGLLGIPMGKDSKTS